MISIIINIWIKSLLYIILYLLFKTIRFIQFYKLYELNQFILIILIILIYCKILNFKLFKKGGNTNFIYLRNNVNINNYIYLFNKTIFNIDF